MYRINYNLLTIKFFRPQILIEINKLRLYNRLCIFLLESNIFLHNYDCWKFGYIRFTID